MIHTLIPAFFLVLLAIAGFALSLLFRKTDFYENGSISRNPNMKKLGITCVKNDELECPSCSTSCDSCTSQCQ